MIRRVLGVAFATAMLGVAAGAALGDEPRPTPEPAAEKDGRPEATEEIVVTGSRVKRKDLYARLSHRL